MKRIDRKLFTALDIIGQGTSKLQELIDQGADVNAQADKKYEEGDAKRYYDGLARVFAGYTPLMVLAGRDGGHEGKNIAFLIECGADIHVENDAGFTPLVIAAIHGNYDGVEALLKAGAGRKDDALVEACNHAVIMSNKSLVSYDRKLTIEALLREGANLNGFATYDGDTPLTMAIRSHEENSLTSRLTEIVKYLVSLGADPLLPSRHRASTPVEMIRNLPVSLSQVKARDEFADHLQSIGENRRLGKVIDSAEPSSNDLHF